VSYRHLLSIDAPEDLRKLPETELRRVSDEVREYLVDTITRVGGHFGAGLGTVELTVALHYVYNTPHDKIVIDTGHQAYPHKILPGRRDQLHTIRQKGGLSGFLKRSESAFDDFGAGHATTSISAASNLWLGLSRRIYPPDPSVKSGGAFGHTLGCLHALQRCC
jgi:1-deoxy-D-xylulose-5-phosphate synthase